MAKPQSGKTTVVVHPLVLLSVVDHYHRSCKDTKNRAVGVLLGFWRGENLEVTNSFAVPFEEDHNNANVWFLDHDYLENMAGMFRKVNAKEKIVGWYHTGPKLRASDLQINEVLKRFTPHPALVIVDVVPKEVGLPTTGYVSVDEVHDDGTPPSQTFEHLATEIGAEEAEEVGVEHLLRDVRGLGDEGTLGHRLATQLAGVRGLHERLQDIYTYLGQVAAGTLPLNHQITALLQDIFNLLPNVAEPTLAAALTSTTSDRLAAMYLASVVRATLALHALISNKLANMDAEKEAEDRNKALERRKEKEAAAAAAASAAAASTSVAGDKPAA